MVAESKNIPEYADDYYLQSVKSADELESEEIAMAERG